MAGGLKPFWLIALKVSYQRALYFHQQNDGRFSLVEVALDATAFDSRDAAADYLQSLREENPNIYLMRMMAVEEHDWNRSH